MSKGAHYYKLAQSTPEARYNLGVFEEKADNYDRAAKHFLVAVVVRHLQKMHMCVSRAILTPLALWTQQKLYLH